MKEEQSRDQRPATAAYRPPSMGARARALARTQGALPVARDAVRWVAQYVASVPRTFIGSADTFAFRGVSYRYLLHRYNYTWLNERAVEVPIAHAAVARIAGGRVLEVGNVLGHYVARNHLVVDRYEHAPGVINTDIFDFEDEEGFDLIVSVSTLEHVGWDEAPRDPGAAARGFAHLFQLLKPGGELLVTVPVGYNHEFDTTIRDGEIELSGLWALRRQERHNVWREVDPAEVWQARYDWLLYTAHGLVVCMAKRPV
jgi:SAM-dependent methyltransferase